MTLRRLVPLIFVLLMSSVLAWTFPASRRRVLLAVSNFGAFLQLAGPPIQGR